MTANAKLWAEQFIDEDGVPFGLCYAQFFDATGVSRKAVWTDRGKTLPSGAGTTANIDGDAEGWVTAYGDGVYYIVVRAAGDDGTNAPIRVFEDVQLQDAMPSYDGPTTGMDLETLEESFMSGQGRQAAATSAQSGTTVDLSKFDSASGTYLVEGTSTLLVFQKVSVEDYEDGATIRLECLTNPIKLRAKRAGEGSGYNLEIGTDFLMSVGSSITLELRNGSWYEVARSFFWSGYQELQNVSGGFSTSATLVAAGPAVRVRGTGNITSIWWVKSGEYAPPGQTLDLYFVAGAVVVDGATIDLDGNYTGQTGGHLSLLSTGAGWVERSRRGYTEPNTTATLGAPSSGSVSVAGGYDVYYTGANMDEIKRLTNPGLAGRIITIIFNGYKMDGSIDDGPTGTYTNSRKYLRHRGATGEGYIELRPGCDWGTLPGDKIMLQLVKDKDNVLYWAEMYRSEAQWITRLEGNATLVIWRNFHRVTNETGAVIDVTNIVPIRNSGHIIQFFFGGPDKVNFAEGGNFAPSPSKNNLNAANQYVEFLSLPDGNPSGVNWGGIDVFQTGE